MNLQAAKLVVPRNENPDWQKASRDFFVPRAGARRSRFSKTGPALRIGVNLRVMLEQNI